ncbi:MAG: hypothetical protein AAGK22_19860 [Acidobacteriota bacterium]
MVSRTFVALVASFLLAGPLLASAATDLSITKTDGVTSAVPGGNVTYTMVVTNTGCDATGISVEDMFSASLTCTWTCSASAGSSCTVAGAGNIADTINLLDGGTATYTAVCAIDASATGTLSNTATVTLAGDSNAANNIATDNDTVLEPSADLSITKTDSTDPVLPGAAFSYTIQVDNAGPSDATGVTVTDTLPAGVTLVSTTGCAEDPNGTPTCTLGTIAAGGSDSFTVNVTAPVASGVVTNTATVSSAADDPVSGNDSASESTTVSTSSDLSITKTDGVTSAVPGDSVTYTITATNNGPDDVTGATVTDTFPTGLTCTWTCSASAGSSCTAAGSGSISESVDLLNGGSATFVAACMIDPGATGTLSNTASITSASTDSVPGNNDATDADTVLAPSSDVELSSSSDSSVTPGGSLTYQLVVANDGPSDASSVEIASLLDASLTFVSSSGCLEDPNGSPTCTVGTVAAGGTAMVTLVTTAPAAGGSISSSFTSSSATSDPVASNDSSTSTSTIGVGIPTAGTWGLILFGLLIAGVGVRFLRF